FSFTLAHDLSMHVRMRKSRPSFARTCRTVASSGIGISGHSLDCYFLAQRIPEINTELCVFLCVWLPPSLLLKGPEVGPRRRKPAAGTVLGAQSHGQFLVAERNV